MKFAVTILRHDGVRLTREEIIKAPVFCGDLIIRDIKGANSEGRALTFAEVLYTRSTFPHGLIGALFEPHLIRMNARWFVLNGWQIRLDANKRKIEYRQEWLVRESTPELEELQESRIREQAARIKANRA